MSDNIEFNLLTHTGFVVLVDNEVAGTLAFNTDLQPGIIAALSSDFIIQPHLSETLPRIGNIWNGTEFVEKE